MTFYLVLIVVIKVIQAIPNAIGALCLNELGQTQLARRPSIIPSIFTLFTSEKHLKVLIDKENAVIIGTAMDELIRHHPSLKKPVFEALNSTLGRIEELANAFTVPADLMHWYHLRSASPPVDVEVSMDVDEQEVPAPGESSDAAGGNDEDDDEKEDDEPSFNNHDNQIVSYIDVLGRVSAHFRWKDINKTNKFTSSSKDFSSIPRIAKTSSPAPMDSRSLEPSQAFPACPTTLPTVLPRIPWYKSCEP